MTRRAPTSHGTVREGVIAGANIFGWMLIGVVLWRAHPGIRRDVDKGLSGA